MYRSLSGLCLFALMATPLANAQESEDAIEEIGPAVDTSVEDFEPAVSSNELQALDANDSEELEPGIPAQVLTADTGNRQRASGIMDELDLGSTEITGNQELPKVLYIVPWRQSDPGDLMGQPANTLLDEILTPVDRREFTREVDYYSDLFGNEDEE